MQFPGCCIQPERRLFGLVTIVYSEQRLATTQRAAHMELLDREPHNFRDMQWRILTHGQPRQTLLSTFVDGVSRDASGNTG